MWGLKGTLRDNEGSNWPHEVHDAVRKQRVVAAALVPPVHLTQREGAKAGSVRGDDDDDDDEHSKPLCQTHTPPSHLLPARAPSHNRNPTRTHQVAQGVSQIGAR